MVGFGLLVCGWCLMMFRLYYFGIVWLLVGGVASYFVSVNSVVY